jgi:hypothetical protein
VDFSTGNRYVDLVIALLLGGAGWKVYEFARNLIFVRLDWRKKLSETQGAELDLLNKKVEALRLLEQELARMHVNLSEAKQEIQRTGDEARREIRRIQEKSIDKVDGYERDVNRLHNETKLLRAAYLTLTAQIENEKIARN